MYLSVDEDRFSNARNRLWYSVVRRVHLPREKRELRYHEHDLIPGISYHFHLTKPLQYEYTYNFSNDNIEFRLLSILLSREFSDEE